MTSTGDTSIATESKGPSYILSAITNPVGSLAGESGIVADTSRIEIKLEANLNICPEAIVRRAGGFDRDSNA